MGQNSGYIAYHSPRYAFLLDLLSKYGVKNTSRVLDIGPSQLTALIRERFGVRVDTLGFEPNREEDNGRHFEFDLNLTQNEDHWREDLPRYEFVIMAEVLEHLHTAPELVLAFVKTLVAENGLFILQTPNAASLQKRVKLLLGYNPYEMIRSDISDPGHFREYTISELRQFAGKTGFHIEESLTSFYFDARFARHAGRIQPQPVVGSIKNVVYRLLPRSLREGVTMVWRRKD